MARLTKTSGSKLRKAAQARKEELEAQTELEAAQLATIVEAAVMMAAIDGHLDQEEVNTIAAFIDAFFNGQAHIDVIAELMSTVLEKIRTEGVQARIEAVATNAPDRETGVYALMVAAMVAHVDGIIEKKEGELFFALGRALGFTDDEAETIAKEVEQDIGATDEL